MTESKSRIAVELLVGFLGVLLVVWAALADDVWFQSHMMRSYCVVEASALPKAHAGRVIAAVAGAILAIVVRPRLGRVAQGRSACSLAGSAARIAVAVFLALVVTDLVLRARGVKPPAESSVRDAKVPPSTSRDAFVGGRTVHYATNRLGFRARTTEDVPDPSAPAIVFIGESIAFGYGLDYDETIPALVAAHTGIQTINLAVNGLGNDEALLRLRQHLPQLAKPVAVVSFVITNRLERNVEDDRSRLALRAGKLEEIAPSSSFLRGSPLRAVLRAAVPYRSDETIELTRAIMREIAETARARGAFALHVVTPCGIRCIVDGPGYPWIVGRLTEGQAFAWILHELPSGLYSPDDGHPNPRGAEAFAGAIERALRSGGAIP